MTKEFDSWCMLKEELHDDHIPPTFNEREIWWCSIGVNIGYEEDGKNDRYNRPVLVVRKFNRQLFLGVPLTTQIKDERFYHHLTFKGKEQCIMLMQIRSWSSKRLTHIMGKLPEGEFEKVRKALRELM